MDGSECKARFAESEIRRFLDEKTLTAYEKLKITKELDEVFPYKKLALNVGCNARCLSVSFLRICSGR